ncbi:hypothetical protein RND81_02G011300 [Saponaria officinalis]|uniref:VOC domain-containing protein n=1 Tax=Saponaria officinalis TaxID=3572 RepID=A0AAW1MPU1_SAPOF
MEGKQERRREEKLSKAPLMALNHVSRLCRSVKKSMEFYTKVLGFVVIERPHAFESFNGAWLFNYGIGIHLMILDPMDNHISFQCEDMEAMEKQLKEFDINYKKRTVEDKDHETTIDQLFFKDPDGFMVEICNCENLKLVPAGSLGQLKLPFASCST